MGAAVREMGELSSFLIRFDTKCMVLLTRQPVRPNVISLLLVCALVNFQ